MLSNTVFSISYSGGGWVHFGHPVDPVLVEQVDEYASGGNETPGGELMVDEIDEEGGSLGVFSAVVAVTVAVGGLKLDVVGIVEAEEVSGRGTNGKASNPYGSALEADDEHVLEALDLGEGLSALHDF